VDEHAEYLSIAEVASLLGVHRNTVRNRVKVGRYKAHKLVTPQGETYAIERESLGVSLPTPTNEGAHSLSAPVHHNADSPSQSGDVLHRDQQVQADAIVQRLLAPFIAELGMVREELGRVKAERDNTKSQLLAKYQTIATQQETIAEAEVLRRRDEQEAPLARPAGPGAREAPVEAQDSRPRAVGAAEAVAGRVGGPG